MKTIKYLLLCIIFFDILGCITTPKGEEIKIEKIDKNAKIVMSINEKNNTTTFAFYIPIRESPYIIPQIYREQDNNTKKANYGLYLDVLNYDSITLKKFNQMTFLIDEVRYDFYGMSAVKQNISEATSKEQAYFFSSKPNIGKLIEMQLIGNASLQDQLDQIYLCVFTDSRSPFSMASLASPTTYSEPAIQITSSGLAVSTACRAAAVTSGIIVTSEMIFSAAA